VHAPEGALGGDDIFSKDAENIVTDEILGEMFTALGDLANHLCVGRVEGDTTGGDDKMAVAVAGKEGIRSVEGPVGGDKTAYMQQVSGG
jgi:hypothetical protein